MKKKNYITLLVLTFIAFLLIGFSNAATYEGSFDVKTGDGSIIIGSGCEEIWNIIWSDCSNNQQTATCIQTNPSCSSTNLKPADCDTTRSCGTTTTTTGGGGGGGGGSSNNNNNNGVTFLSDTNSNTDITEETCTEKWACGLWSDSEELCGVRECRDVNNCGTTTLKPETQRECPGFSISDITGNFVSGVGDFVKSKSGIITIFVLLIIGLFIMMQVSKSNTPSKNPAKDIKIKKVRVVDNKPATP